MDQKIKTAIADRSVKGWWLRYCQIGQLPYVDVVDEADHSVAPKMTVDHDGKAVLSATGVITFDDDSELVGDFYHVSKRKLRQEYSKSIGKKLEEIDEVTFGIEFNSMFPELDENENIVKINSGRRVKKVLRDGKSRGGRRERINIYKIPKLSVCRHFLEIIVGHFIQWDNIDVNWEKTEFKS